MRLIAETWDDFMAQVWYNVVHLVKFTVFLVPFSRRSKRISIASPAASSKVCVLTIKGENTRS